jgi:phosphoribosylformylglycinamidine synthase
MRYVAEVDVSLKPGLLDPQGAAIEGSLPALGWTNVSAVRVGKHVRFELEAADEASALAQVRAMAERLLSNPVIEDFDVRAIGTLDDVHAEDGRR